MKTLFRNLVNTANKHYHVLFILLSFLMLTCQISYANQSLDGIAAVVNDDIITQSALDKRIRQIKNEIKASKQPLPPAGTLHREVLKQMINQNLQLQLAKKYNIQATKKDIDKAIKIIATQNHMTVSELKQTLKNKGLNFADYKQEMKRQITIQKLQNEVVGKDVKINEDDVKETIHELAKKSDNTPQYHIIDILIPLSESPSDAEVNNAKKLAKSLIKKAKQTHNFKVLALNSNSTEYQGADLEWRQYNEIPSVFSKDVLHMKTGQIAGPIKAGNGLHIIQLVGIRGKNLLKEQKSELDNKARDLIYQQEFDKKLVKWLKDLRDAAYIKTF